MYDDIGSNLHNDDPLIDYKRIDIMSIACRLGHSDCVNTSITQYRDWMNRIAEDPNSINT